MKHSYVPRPILRAACFRTALASTALLGAAWLACTATPLAHAAEAGPALTLSGHALTLSAEQAQRMGLATTTPRAQAAMASARVPAMVVVPPSQLAVVAVPMPGVVEQVTVAPQQAVRRGQVLATLRSPALADAQRAYVEASVQSQLAEQALKRDTQLRADGIIAESRFLATQSAAQREAASLAVHRQELALAGLSAQAIEQLARSQRVESALTLVAPRDGVLVDAVPSPGQRLEAGAPAFRIAKLDPLWVEIQAGVDLARRLRTGLGVKVVGTAAEGRILAVGRTVDPANTTVSVRAEITRGAAQLFANQPVEVELSLQPAGGAATWAIPDAALVRVKGSTAVFVRTANGVHTVPVTVAQEGRGELLVSGLAGGEAVVVKGVSQLKSLAEGAP